MKEIERSIVNKREKLPREFYISGAIWSTVTIGALVGLLIHSTKAAEREYQDQNFGFSPRVERLADEIPGRLLVEIEPEENQRQAEPRVEFKNKNIPLEKSRLVQSEVMEIVENNPQVFSKQDVADIEMYYPIYKAAGDKFNVDWYLLWIVHQKESTVSRNPNAFNGSNGYAGAMQRNPYFYPEETVDGASEGLEYLAELPQRHPTDSREIAVAAWKISRDREVVQNRGGSQPLLSALQAYGDDGEAYKRWQTYNGLKPIFS